MTPAKEYRPAAFDPANVKLEPHLQACVEQIARLNHDAWAAARQREGWRYGEARDDTRKEHPGLVPYEELSESEKQYDRNAATTTIKALSALGYRLVPPDIAPDTDPDSRSRLAETLRSFIRTADVPALVRLWQEHEPRAWTDLPELYVALGAQFIRRGEALLAYEVVNEALVYWPEHERLRHIEGLALARSGATRRANAIAERLSESVRDPELVEDAIALLGRTHKDLALAAGSAEERRSHLRRALEAYGRAFERSGQYYAAINAGSMAFLLGDTARAAEHATAARALAADAAESDYWARATIGEASVILGELDAAGAHYRAAAAAAGRHFGDIGSMRRQLRLLLDARGTGEPSWVADALGIPAVVAFAGDTAGGERDMTRLRRELDERLSAVGAGFAYSAAARGAEIVFLEAMSARGGETHVILPYPREQFIRDRVAASDDEWAGRFDRVTAAAAEVFTASSGWFEAGGLVQEYTDMLLLGLAKVQSLQLETDLVVMAACDERDTDGDGRGAGATVRRWREYGYDVSVLPLGERP